ncbi:MAG: 1-acyl-sn-glycerol-3-phosphate acyltransferase [Alphaproteobacteria bacterium]|nr:1-acyl-sn-glycerol-3-phosphate acyltransferase [Alphaproteobacteria bacterium]
MLRLFVGLRVEIRGDVTRLQGPALIACNHQSAWDTMVFLWLCPLPTYAMKKELMAIPMFGWMAKRQGHIAVDRKAGAAAFRRLQRQASAALAAGRQIVLFPEGTRVAPDQRRPYQPGIAGLYSALGAPVVPVAVNSGLFWPRRSFIKRPGTVVLEILPEIPPGLRRAEFLAELELRISGAAGRLIAEARRADPRL